MKKFLIPILIVASLSITGCAGIQKATEAVRTTVQAVVNPDTFDTVTIAYGSALAVANGYYDLCERKVIHKQCWKVIETLQPYEDKAYRAYKVLQRFVKENPNLDASSFIKIAKDAITAFKDTQAIYGVK